MSLGRAMGWTSAQWTILGVVGVAAFVVAPAVWSRFGHASDAIFWATGLVILFYTIETQAMRQEMVAANKMAVQPLLVTTIENPEHAAGAEIFVKNIGKGPALRIRFADVEFLDGGSGGTLFRVAGKFYTADCLEAGEKHPIIVPPGVAQAEGLHGDDWIKVLNPRTAKENYRITITYEDMKGRELTSVMQMGADGTKLMRSGE